MPPPRASVDRYAECPSLGSMRVGGIVRGQRGRAAAGRANGARAERAESTGHGYMSGLHVGNLRSAASRVMGRRLPISLRSGRMAPQPLARGSDVAGVDGAVEVPASQPHRWNIVAATTVLRPHRWNIDAVRRLAIRGVTLANLVAGGACRAVEHIRGDRTRRERRNF